MPALGAEGQGRALHKGTVYLQAPRYFSLHARNIKKKLYEKELLASLILPLLQ